MRQKSLDEDHFIRYVVVVEVGQMALAGQEMLDEFLHQLKDRMSRLTEF